MTASDGDDDGFVARWVARNRQGSAPDLPAMTHRNHARVSSIGSSTDNEDGGVRLSALSLNDSSDRVESRHSEIIDHASSGSQAMFTTRPLVTEPRNVEDGSRPRFELGERPSGDVFLSEPGQLSGGRLGNSRLAIVQRDEIVHGTGEGLGSPTCLSRDQQDNSPVTVIRRDMAMHGSGSLGSPAHLLRNRSSNISGRHQVGGVDAQGIYPPTACVFVANLPEPKEDRALEAAVTREFSKFGTVFIKIRRDPHNMPFAFCQYTMAMELAKGAMILGRPCRTEMVKANRAFFIYRHRGGPITLEEAKSVLEPYGALVRADYSPSLQKELGVDAAVIVEFSTFDLTRDLHSAFRNNDIYCVDAFDSRRGLPRRTDADEAFLNQYDIDRRSIFVGNLPVHIEEDAVMELCSIIGKVNKVQLIKKTNSFGTRAFAFVEFDRADTPEIAVSQLTRSLDKMGDNFAPATPRAQPSVDRLNQRNAPDGQPAPALAQPSPALAQSVSPALGHPVSPAWNWMHPGQSPTQLALNSQAFIGGPGTSYGTQIGHPTAPVTPQSPESFNPYAAAYYSPIWPSFPFVQNPIAGAMSSFYTTYGAPNVAGFLDQENSSGDLDTPTRTHRATTGNQDQTRGDTDAA
ncbi:hypothetical protein RB593_000689 [Gaeumannomyces tritici]